MQGKTAASSAQQDSSTSARWALNWSRAISLSGPQPLVLVPLRGDGALFAGRPVQGTRYLVVARDAIATPTGLLVELLLQRSATPVDTAALFAALYRSYRAGAPTPPTQGTGWVFFYSADYRYRTGRQFKKGVLQPGAGRLAFRARNTTTQRQGASKYTKALTTKPTYESYDSVICTDWYYVNSNGTLGDYITTTGDCSGPPGSGGIGGPSSGGPYGGYGDGGWGGGGGGGGGDTGDDTGSGDPGTPQCRACPIGTTPPPPRPPASFPTSVIINSSVYSDPKAKCVLTQLQNNAQFQELLKNFQSSSKYNVSFNLGIPRNGGTGDCTWNTSTSTATILINPEPFGLQHAIWGATTFFHETYHAQLQQYAIATFGTLKISTWPKPINNMTLQELIGYVDATASTNSQWQTATHNYMAYNNTIMAEGLRAFVQVNYPQTYAEIGSDIGKYSYLSMMGLENTTRFLNEVTAQGKNADYYQAINDFITSERPGCL